MVGGQQLKKKREQHRVLSTGTLLFFNLIRSYMIIINHTFIIANRVTLLK